MRNKITTAIFLIFLLFNFTGNAQIGIGTTDPAMTSILDITSSNKGILIPRMTSAQRMAIASPANSLLIYDITERLFFYYDTQTQSWIPITTGVSTKRNNYKLIKSASDLQTELTAGGGSKYLLTSNTTYEINGTITLTAPIDLNNAYIVGLDANEDILMRSGGTLFSGSTGGTIKTLTLTAPSGTVFSLAGSSNQNLVFRDAIVAGSGSVGSISGYGLVFSNVINYVGNSQGITYSNIGQLLLANQAWNGNNSGIYETFSGSFQLIQKLGGYSEVNTVTGSTATAGIKTTGITSISGAAVIENVVFYGSGTYVVPNSPYTNYNFTNSWFVESPGIPVEKDGVASGYYYMTDNTLPTAITDVSIPVKIKGTTVSSNLFRTATNGFSNRLVYTGSKTRNFEISATGTVIPGSNNVTHVYHIYKNGQPVSSVTAERRFSSNDIGNFSLTGIISLTSGDYIEVYLQASTVSSPVVSKMNVVLK